MHNVLHVSNICPYRLDNKFERANIPPPPLQLMDGTTKLLVGKIVRHRIRNQQTEYLAKWTGYPFH
jgi:hypothetical protein